MSNRRTARSEEKVRAYIEEVRNTNIFVDHWVTLKEVADKAGVKEALISLVFQALNREGVMSSKLKGWGNGGTSFKVFALSPLPERPRPREVKVAPLSPKWGQKRVLLRRIRLMKPWVIERWYEKEGRWFLYMGGVSPDEQPRLSKNKIARWHFDLETAMKEVVEIRMRYGNGHTFRIRETGQGDYLMADILTQAESS